MSKNCCISRLHVYSRAASLAVRCQLLAILNPLLVLIYCQHLTHSATGWTAAYHVGTRCWRMFLLMTLCAQFYKCTFILFSFALLVVERHFMSTCGWNYTFLVIQQGASWQKGGSGAVLKSFFYRDVTKFEFEFECWRISNFFAKFEIRRIVGDACIGCGSHFHAHIDAKHALALNAVNDSQHTSHSHNYKVLALWPPTAAFAAGREGCCCSGGDQLGRSNSKFSHSCYMRHLAIIMTLAWPCTR